MKKVVFTSEYGHLNSKVTGVLVLLGQGCVKKCFKALNVAGFSIFMKGWLAFKYAKISLQASCENS